jgi:hypothetical protein
MGCCIVPRWRETRGELSRFSVQQLQSLLPWYGGSFVWVEKATKETSQSEPLSLCLCGPLIHPTCACGRRQEHPAGNRQPNFPTFTRPLLLLRCVSVTDNLSHHTSTNRIPRPSTYHWCPRRVTPTATKCTFQRQSSWRPASGIFSVFSRRNPPKRSDRETGLCWDSPWARVHESPSLTASYPGKT